VNIHTNLTILKLDSLIYIMLLTDCVYLHSNFSGGCRKIFFILSISTKGAFQPFNDIQNRNRKRTCAFILVRNSNVGPILHRFGARTRFMCFWPHPYSTLILGVFSLHQIAHGGP